MSVPRAVRRTGRLAAAVRAARARLRGRGAALALVLVAGLGAWVSVVAGAPAFASGEAGGWPGGTGSSPTAAGSSPAAAGTSPAAAGVWCPTLHRRASLPAGEPVTLTPGVGSTQSTHAGAQFPLRLAVTATDAEGNPVPGVPVTFSAPAAGASGRFAGRSSIVRSRGSHHDRSRVSHPRMVRVETGACGIAVAPVFTANGVQGGYIVKASVEHVRPAAFALVNEAS